jgi:hypothetical protein
MALTVAPAERGLIAGLHPASGGCLMRLADGQPPTHPPSVNLEERGAELT